MAEPRWVVFGAGGMLGTDLVHLLREQQRPVVALRHANADITDAASIAPHIQAGDIVVNTAAYTLVDDAETHRDQAFAINAQGPANLAQVCMDRGARLIHISTDYVFGDAAFGIPIATDAPYSPRCVYGESKARGEQHVRDLLGDSATIARVAWLYGAHGRNFVHTIRTHLDQGQPLRVVNDQWGQPTWTADVAHALTTLADQQATGIHHCTSSGHTTWYDFARAIAQHTGHNPDTITPIPSRDFPTPAKRPMWSVLEVNACALSWDARLVDFLAP